MSDVSNNGEKIYIHFAKKIIDQHGFVYKSDVLKLIKVNTQVRISFSITESEIETWSFDSPYVKIISINKDSCLGQIMDINRQITNMYPLNVGDKIWFKKDNIIEIPIGSHTNEITYQNSEDGKFRKFLTKERVMCTGPLYCIESESDESDSENGYSASDSD